MNMPYPWDTAGTPYNIAGTDDYDYRDHDAAAAPEPISKFRGSIGHYLYVFGNWILRLSQIVAFGHNCPWIKR